MLTMNRMNTEEYLSGQVTFVSFQSVHNRAFWTPKGYSRRQSDLALFTLGHPRVTVAHQSDSALFALGHLRVTVARQSDWALFALGLNLAKSTSLAMRKKVPNHSP
jgi:hypothetical protein